MLGRGRATQYALLRSVRDLAPEFPVHRVSASGEAKQVGTLVTVQPGRFWYEDLEESRKSALFPSLPWFMTDMRPQGYLGRLFPSTYPDVGLPERIVDWNEDQTLYALARRGEDVVGNLIVGNESLARWLDARAVDAAIAPEDRLQRYAALTDQALSGRAPGSSAAGEQPKFTAVIETEPQHWRHVLVKFSGRLEIPSARRWADLLLAEHLASVVLSEHGYPAVQSEYLEDGGRAYLEVERFDRQGARGRMGLISLGALDDEFVGERAGWAESSTALRRMNLISNEDARKLRWLSAFGALIGNTDMHLGNVSFLVDKRRVFRLAPVYDMLPMCFAPARDELISREFIVPKPSAGHADQWRAALPAARVFWRRLANDGRLSAQFQALAHDCRRRIESL